MTHRQSPQWINCIPWALAGVLAGVLITGSCWVGFGMDQSARRPLTQSATPPEPSSPAPNQPTDRDDQDRSAGIGVSLSRVQELWIDGSNWYWSSKHPAQHGPGIDWIAKHLDPPAPISNAVLRVIGHPDHLQSIRVGVDIKVDPGSDDNEILICFAVPLHIASETADLDNVRLYQWAGERIKIWLESHQTTNTSTLDLDDGRTLELVISGGDGSLNVMISVSQQDRAG